MGEMRPINKAAIFLFLCALVAPARSLGQRVALTIKSDSSAVSAGDKIGITIEEINLTSDTMPIFRSGVSGVDVTFDYDIRDQTGNPLPHNDLRGVEYGHLVNLPPRIKYTRHVRVSDICDMSQPGSYTVQVATRDDEHNLVKSNVIRIDVK
jgi:hypothetical protein